MIKQFLILVCLGMCSYYSVSLAILDSPLAQQESSRAYSARYAEPDPNIIQEVKVEVPVINSNISRQDALKYVNSLSTEEKKNLFAKHKDLINQYKSRFR
jgi:hypothetical protein